MNIQTMLPSQQFQKRAVLILGLVLVLVVGTTLIKKTTDKNDDSNAAFKFSKLDTDKDGLRDWEEDVWGTDKNNPDTDGDGVPDGQEVQEDRDPNKTGDDSLTDSRLASVYSAYKRHALQNINVTNEISNRILPHSLLLANDLQNNPSLVTTRNTDKLIDPIVAQYRVEESSYALADLKLTSVTPDSLSNYFVEILEIANSGLASPAGNEVTLSMNQNNVNLDKQLNNYRQVVSRVQNMSVPSSLGEPHLKVLNNFATMESVFKVLASAGDNDPAKSLYAVEELKSLQTANLAAIENLAAIWRSESLRVTQ